MQSLGPKAPCSQSRFAEHSGRMRPRSIQCPASLAYPLNLEILIKTRRQRHNSARIGILHFVPIPTPNIYRQGGKSVSIRDCILNCPHR